MTAPKPPKLILHRSVKVRLQLAALTGRESASDAHDSSLCCVFAGKQLSAVIGETLSVDPKRIMLNFKSIDVLDEVPEVRAQLQAGRGRLVPSFFGCVSFACILAH